MKTRGFEVVKEYYDKEIHIPVRKTKFSAAYDIEAAEDIVLPSFQKGMKPTLIPTGLKAYMQSDEVLLIVPRSSGPKKQGITFPHNVGVIDSDYYNNIENEGHIWICLQNCGDTDYVVHRGDKICQMMFIKYLTVDDEEEITRERVNGFGSTDRKEG